MKKDSSYKLLIFLCFFTIYLLSKSEILAISHDSIVYVTDMKREGWKFHPHHLLYHDFNSFVIEIVSSLTNEFFKPYTIMSYVNSFFGAGSLVILFSIFRRKQLGLNSSMISTAIVGFHFGFWHYSSNVEVYIIPIFFILLLVREIYKDKKNITLISLFAGLATLFHQSYIFLLPIVFITLWYNKHKMKDLIKFTTIYTIIVAVPYILVAVLIEGSTSISDFMKWITYYSHALPENWKGYNPFKLILNDVIGMSRSIVSTQFLLTNDSILDLINKLIPGKSLSEEQYLLRNMTSLEFFLVIAGTAVAALIQVILLVKLFKKFLTKEFRKLHVFEFLYLLIFITFFTVWSSENPEFWISISLIISIIVYGNNLLSERNKKLFLVALIIQNFFGFILYVVNEENDIYLKEYQLVERNLNKNAQIITNGDFKIHGYLEYNGFKNIYLTDDSLVTINNETYYLKLKSYPDDLMDKYKNLTKVENNLYKIEKVKL
jgi:hypothetical protein